MDDKYARSLRALRQLTPQDIEVDEQVRITRQACAVRTNEGRRLIRYWVVRDGLSVPAVSAGAGVERGAV